MNYLPAVENVKIQMQNASHTLCFFELHTEDDQIGTSTPTRGSVNRTQLRQVYFGELVSLKFFLLGEGVYDNHICAQISGGGNTAPTQYNLRARVYIGNTTMDPQLAMIMANVAGVRRDALVLDPFAGTGWRVFFDI